jgi:hypothetical protein
MVKAILEGRKTSTRRITKFRPYTSLNETNGDFEICESETQNFFRCLDDFIEWAIVKCRYKVGDILYVRETWNFLPCTGCDTTRCCNEVPIKFKGQSGCFSYKINSNVDTEKWKPSIHMPKFAARIFLKVTDIKVQILQDITEDEAQQEGIDPEVAIEYSNWRPTFYDPDSGGEPNYREALKDLWDELYKKKGYGWDSNPWVFVISFKRVEKEG